MSRASQVVIAALLRPLGLVVLGLGLILSLTYAPWWTFPLSLVFYGVMVVLSLRDRAFVEKAAGEAKRTDTDDRIDWSVVAREGQPVPKEIWAPLQRIATTEAKLTSELASAPEGARAVLASTLGQIRSAARLGIELARKVQALDRSLLAYPALNPQQSHMEANERRRRAAAASDEQAKSSLLEAAKSLDESAAVGESMLKLRERTVAQLESLAASLENVAVRSIRLRVHADGAEGDVADALRVDVDALKETLELFEEPSMTRGREG
jgi:hypothetical protein